MSGARRGTNFPYRIYRSDIVPSTDSVAILGVDCGQPHCFCGLQLFEDSGGLLRAFPIAGSVRIQVQTLSFGPVLEDPPNNIIDMANLRTIDWAANTLEVHATPQGVSNAPFYRVLLVTNVS